jgi:hypothetical protein
LTVQFETFWNTILYRVLYISFIWNIHVRNQIIHWVMVCYFHIHCRREQVVLLHVCQAMICDSISGCTNFRYLVTPVSKLYAVAPNISNINMVIFPGTQKCVLLHSHQAETTRWPRFTGHSRVVGPQLGTFFMLSIIWRWLLDFWKFVVALNSYTAHCLKATYSSKHTLAFHVSELDVIAICTIWLVLQLSIK